VDYEPHEYLNKLIRKLLHSSLVLCFRIIFVLAVAVVVQLKCKGILALDDGNSHRMDVRHRISTSALQVD
jgi:hypothetical protein